ncbi:sensor histidine kinase [Georgfuchsia toluolica]|nr:sensor histidine kinase [Georgfuchsia toluolica]
MARELKAATEWWQSAIANVPCVTFTLQRNRTGSLRLIDISANCQKLLHIRAEDLMASFDCLAEVLDPAEYSRLEEVIAVAAAKRSGLLWEGRLRARNRQKAKWIRLQAQTPKALIRTVTWQGVITDFSREHDLDLALKRSREQLSELSAYLEAGKEEERERIARDIHDELGSILVALKIEAALLTSKLPKNQLALRDKARSIETMLDQAMGTASRVARELRPGILKEFGLSAAIECQAEDFSQRTGITCRAQCDDDGLEVEERCALALFRIVQEALTNVAKHAHASLVAIRLYRDRQQLIVEIRDNGRGIGETDLHKPKSFGLRGIRERVRSLNGELSVSAGEQGGTHIVLSLPLKSSSRRTAVEEDVQHKLF